MYQSVAGNASSHVGVVFFADERVVGPACDTRHGGASCQKCVAGREPLSGIVLVSLFPIVCWKESESFLFDLFSGTCF